MAKRFIGPKTNTLVINERCKVICHEEQNYQTEILNNILYGLREELAIQLFFGFYNDRLWDYNIFIVDSHESFLFVRYKLPSTWQERFFNFFILLTWSSNNEVEFNETLYKIFNTAFRYNVRNVVIMCKAFNGDHISFYAYEVFNNDQSANNITIHEINRYENGTLKNEFLFPDHINDFHGCWLNVSAHKVPPLLTFHGDVNNETHLIEINRLSGIEGDILRAISKSLNFKIRLRFPEEGNIIHYYSDSEGCFGDLDRERSHIAIGGFSSTQWNSDKYSKSFVYHNTPYVFVIRSGVCFGPIKQLLNPLCLSTWTFLLILFSASFIFTKLTHKKPKVRDFVFGSKNKTPICSMFIIFFGNALPTRLIPRRNFARFLMAAWLLLSFEVRNGYQGKMFDSLRFSQRIPMPQKMTQLIEQDYTLLTHLYHDFYPANKTQIIANTTRRMHMLQMSTSRLTSTALLDSLAHYNYKNWKTSTLTYVGETIHSFPCVMYFRKHSMLRPSIDRKLKIFSDAGITAFIARKHVRAEFLKMNTRSEFNCLPVNRKDWKN
ncbi:uncharacterized protein LOC119608840 [Lucilia sericata]|uniref:uncharacterized protein LOC119608840 n=1 Tax=Lucilia sericata TaxID=13632 RepID=UPI0018A800E6|nr:uncharacterized protein LOC119608840 [Lucilia sericata]